MMFLPSVQEMEAYIRQAAIARGMDPDVAVRVAKSEGLGKGIWQGTANLSYGRERSYGPFQLHVDPRPGHEGLGNRFINDMRMDPSNPATWRQGVDYALNEAAQKGWGQWFGAKKVGVSNFEGIRNAQPLPMMASMITGGGGGPDALAGGIRVGNEPDPNQPPPSLGGIGAPQGLMGLGDQPPQSLVGIGPPSGLPDTLGASTTPQTSPNINAALQRIRANQALAPSGNPNPLYDPLGLQKKNETKKKAKNILKALSEYKPQNSTNTENKGMISNLASGGASGGLIHSIGDNKGILGFIKSLFA